MIKGSSIKNGRLPVLVNYIWPALAAAVPTVLFYFSHKSWYASTEVHCFASIYSSLFWTFIIPAWTLWFIVLVRNQLSITACRQSRLTADKEQLYWARKTCKGLPILLSWFLMTFFTLLFAVDMQLFWLCITYVVLVTIFGPMLFILHTHNYVNSCNGMYSLTHLSFYNPCVVKRPQIAPGPPPPAPPPPPAQLLKNDVKEVVDPPVPPAPIVLNPTSTPGGNVVSLPTPIILPAVQQPVGVPSQMLTDPNTGPASAQQFYDWLTDRNVDNIDESENILFRPRPV